VADEQDLQELPPTPISVVTLTWRHGDSRFVCDLRGVDVLMARRMLERAAETMEIVLPDVDLQLDDRFISISGFGPDGERLESGPTIIMGSPEANPLPPPSVDEPAEDHRDPYRSYNPNGYDDTYDLDDDPGDDPPCQSA
jgi:hypothetical protein